MAKTRKSAQSGAGEEMDGIVIEKVSPEVDGGKFPAKCIVGEMVTVEADIFKDGHDVLGACIKFKKKSDEGWDESPMTFFDNDRWRGTFVPQANTRYLYTLEAWMDRLLTWCRDTEKKCLGKVDIKSDILEGIGFVKAMAKSASEGDKPKIDLLIKNLKLAQDQPEKVLALIRDQNFLKLMAKYPLKEHLTAYDKTLEMVVDRSCAEFGAWYELFPRSQGKIPNKSATFKDCIARIPDIKKMGFDIIYLTPIHPIGLTNRKGPNNTLNADRNAPGSPWAIGSELGGHKAIHPELGTMKDFEDYVRAARENGMEIALDIAFQCSPDHPYAKEHPEWFYHLPDGTIRYAENPPKKYEDIYPLDFNCADRQALWDEMKSIIVFWIEKGVKIFRVDNPHTKPLSFWKWLIDGVQKDHPETIFFAEAFTRPKVMKYLAKSGFTQSYTYFTWRNAKAELRQYFEELTQTDMKDYYRGNLFANTPDILHEFLQTGGRPAFQIRLVLAATLSSSYGIYSGFELCENKAKAPASEEYLDSEKYQYKVWDWNRADHIKEFIAKVNQIRASNPALQLYKNLEFHHSSNEAILCYGKRTRDNGNMVVVTVNLDPFRVQEDQICLPLWKFGIEDWQTYQVHDLLNNKKYSWKGPSNYVRLDPQVTPAHIFLIKK
ncbi:MAG: alpha-1,4-glucan--maltose-1-phosphate maltosyltransferase [Candidatus Omnitrophica bacterium]|nr:alpha-1,4-glucan--maltose-1-phosphate maltosyltransferase [Candidatus Omnitrophota bacterium]MDD5672276.1 alpha-1,4-glucan--maltose-1-phosphate maltosyltransferase [Candidatus Omnitrophota bacterium]